LRIEFRHTFCFEGMRFKFPEYWEPEEASLMSNWLVFVSDYRREQFA
jgi:hypothetical protein